MTVISMAKTRFVFISEIFDFTFVHLDVTDRKRRQVSINQCLTSDDCDVGDMCNMDSGEDGGLCETCPGNTENDCYDAGFNQQLGTEECLNVCVGQASEYSSEIYC